MSGEYMNEEEKHAYEVMIKTMRERQAAERLKAIQKHDAKMLEMELDQATKMSEMTKRNEKEISAAMQAWKSNTVSRRVYHEAPDDVFELIVFRSSDVGEDRWGSWVGMGGLNALRLVSKRCLRAVESVATRLTRKGYADSLPQVTLKRCKRIEHIRCIHDRWSIRRHNSLEGCPDGLKSLYIGDGFQMKSLEPLSACKELESLEIYDAHPLFSLLLYKAQEAEPYLF
jgi:hypothetical protein